MNRTVIKFLPWMFVVGLLICPPPLGEWALSPTLSVSFCVMKSCISSKFSGQYIPRNFVFQEFLDHHLNYFFVIFVFFMLLPISAYRFEKCQSPLRGWRLICVSWRLSLELFLSVKGTQHLCVSLIYALLWTGLTFKT